MNVGLEVVDVNLVADWKDEFNVVGEYEHLRILRDH